MHACCELSWIRKRNWLNLLYKLWYRQTRRNQLVDIAWMKLGSSKGATLVIGPVYRTVLIQTGLSPAKRHDMEPEMKQLSRQWEWLKLRQGALFRHIYYPRDGEEIYQLVVPESLWRKVYESQHEREGHFRERSKLALLRQSYYWLTITREVQGWIEQYKWWTLARDVFPKTRAPMTCFNVTAPLEVLAMDYTVLERSAGMCWSSLIFTVAVLTKNSKCSLETLVCVLWVSCSSTFGPRTF